MTNQEETKVSIPYKDNFFDISKFGIYDFYRVSIRTGETPASLKEQSFTNLAYAETAVNNYIHKMTAGVKPVKISKE